METVRPLILLTNDDGYLAAGIRALYVALRTIADVVIVAPEAEQSASSHSLSLHRPLRLREVEPGIYAVDGTPADCVYVALHAATKPLPRRPDLVVSGLNHGVNLGTDVFYSGTVGGAREGALRGIPALAASADMRAARPAAAALCTQIALVMLARRRAGGAVQLLNVNVPPGDGPWPVRATVLGARVYQDEVVVSRDPRGREYMWIGGSSVRHHQSEGSDTEAFDEGVASITPLLLNLTALHGRDDAVEIARAAYRSPQAPPLALKTDE